MTITCKTVRETRPKEGKCRKCVIVTSWGGARWECLWRMWRFLIIPAIISLYQMKSLKKSHMNASISRNLWKLSSMKLHKPNEMVKFCCLKVVCGQKTNTERPGDGACLTCYTELRSCSVLQICQLITEKLPLPVKVQNSHPSSSVHHPIQHLRTGFTDSRTLVLSEVLIQGSCFRPRFRN